MAKIMNVDYEAIPAQAKQIRTQAQELNNQITSAYQNIANMHSSWYGKRYNQLVKSFNNIKEEVNELLALVVEDIPFALENVANNYSQADKGSNVTTVSKTAPKKVANIALSNDVGMRFLTTEVSNTKQLVSNNFKNAKNKMNEIEATYGKIRWQSEASEAFKSKFNKLKNNIIKAFDEIESDFSKLMNQAINDVQSAEGANTVK